MPAEEIAQIFLEVIEGGKSVEASNIIEFVADNGNTILEGVETVANLGNGIAEEVTSVTEVVSTGSVTSGLGLLAVDVGVAGAAIAPALGVLAGVGLYNLAPEFWTNVSNKLLEAGQTIGGKVHALLTSEGKVAYSEQTIEIFKEALYEAGAFTSQGYFPPSDVTPLYNDISYYNFPLTFSNTCTASYVSGNTFNLFATNNDYPVYVAVGTIRNTFDINPPRDANDFIFYMFSEGPFTFNLLRNGQLLTTWTSDSHTHDGLTVYYVGLINDLAGGTLTAISFLAFIAKGISNNKEYASWDLLYCIKHGIASGNVDLQPDATYPTADPFPQTYPEWQPIPIPESLPLPNYYPVELPYALPEQEQAQNPLPLPETDPDPWVRWIIENLPIPEPNPNPYPEPGPAPEPDPDPQPEPEPAPEPDPEPAEPNPPDPNEPVEPDPVPFIPPVLDTVDSTKIFTVYNPTSAELDALGAYLWSNDVLETIVKIWQNPLDGVISLRQVYCTPVAGGSHNIILGSLDSGVSAAVVTSQFTTIDCGSVTIGEKNKNVTDYSPYATVHLYLPFIGIVQLDIDEVMNSALNVKYTIDVYTGTCLAEVYVTRSPDMTVSKILYTFSGNCSQTLPLTASDATGLASTLASLGAAAIGIVAGGGALGAVAGASMVGHSLTHEMINIGHSGSLSSNAGIMGQRKPYVIIGRRHGYDANSYNEIYGYPTNKTVFLSNCTGYVRIKAINLQSAATEEEKKEIIQLLKQGVIM